jgi:hypothetical protein
VRQVFLGSFPTRPQEFYLSHDKIRVVVNTIKISHTIIERRPMLDVIFPGAGTSKMTKKVIAASIAALMLTGCATIFNGTTQVVKINSAPEGATLTVMNRAGQQIHNGTTPASLTLNRGAGYFRGEQYTVKLSKAGFKDKEVTLTSNLGGWYWGNLLLGGLLGMLIIDPISGGMYNIAPENVSEAMDAMNVKTSKADGGLMIVLAQDVPASVWKNAKALPAPAL